MNLEIFNALTVEMEQFQVAYYPHGQRLLLQYHDGFWHGVILLKGE